MKKILAIMMTAVLLLSFASCGMGEKKEYVTRASSGDSSLITDSPAGKFPDFIKDYIDASHYAKPHITDSVCEYTLSKDFYPEYVTDETKHLLTDGAVTFSGGSVLRLKMPIYEVLKQGWQFTSNADKNAVVRSYEGMITVFKNADKEIQLICQNEKDRTIKKSESTIGGFHIVQYDINDSFSKRLPSAVDFTMERGINQGSDLKAILTAFGEPYSVKLTVKNNDFSYITVEYRDKGAGTLMFTLTSDGAHIAEVSY